MASTQSVKDAIVDNPYTTYGTGDALSSYINREGHPSDSIIKTGTVLQFNVGMYSALVSTRETSVPYVCSIGTLRVSPGLGYSDATVLREGDEVLFLLYGKGMGGMILAKKPTASSVDETHPEQTKSDTDSERRTHFFSNDCYRKKSQVYDNPLKDPNDISTGRYLCSRPTDLLPGETGMLNPYRCGYLFGLYSASLVGGGAQIRLFSLENRIRMVADSIIQHTLFGNRMEWHSRQYLSMERASCMYQEERLGMASKNIPAFDKADYHEDWYFTKNKKKRQTLRPRIVEQEGYFGGLSAKYFLRPDPMSGDPELPGRPRTMDEEANDPGVLRESVDPSGQYRLASAGMIGFERIGRIPVPTRIRYPWSGDAEEPKPEALKEFKHKEGKPYYRQLELADRVAYDLKNSYARLDEAKSEFHVPEEEDLADKLEDVYDKGFTDSTTVQLKKYDRRRSGIWQGEDGSVIIRDAWGSEIVMIGGNIQLSCAGNIQILPGKSALTMAGDDIVQKAQNSVDIESADKDVRVNAYKNVQVMAGVDEDHPGGITLDARGKAGPWDAKAMEGGESVASSGILLKSHDGAVVVDADMAVTRATSRVSIASGDESIDGGNGRVDISADEVTAYGKAVCMGSDDSALIAAGTTAGAVGRNILLAGDESTAIFQGNEFLIPLMWAPTDSDPANDLLEKLYPWMDYMVDPVKLLAGYTMEALDNMMFKFRSSAECGTDKSWELGSDGPFTMYQPFWSQVKPKFETLGNVKTKVFDDHDDLWDEDTGSPWPGRDAVNGKEDKEPAKYARLVGDEDSPNSPVNMSDDGLNKPRSEVKDQSPIEEVDLFDGYQIRAN